MSKTAFITGVTGQDGSYLAEYLLKLGYRVVGLARRTSTPNTSRLTDLLAGRYAAEGRFKLVKGDITDAGSLWRVLDRVYPDEIYNLAAQSFVKDSFDEPAHTIQTITNGTLNLLEWVREHAPKALRGIRMYQASSSEMFGNNARWRSHTGEVEEGDCSGTLETDDIWQDEQTAFVPCSPYAVAKVAAHNLCDIYRKSYGLMISCGILMNHESPRRGEEFATRKITRHVGRVVAARKLGKEEPAPLRLGNMKARRDWGDARDYVRAMHMMLQHPKPDDFMIATGVSRSVNDFFRQAVAAVDPEKWGRLMVSFDVSLDHQRPNDVLCLRGESTKAHKELGWMPEISFSKMVSDMVENDIELALKELT